MSYEFRGFVQQGWQCPVCGGVYSPFTPQCLNCTGQKQEVVYSDHTAQVIRTPEEILRRRFWRLEGANRGEE